MPVEEVSEIEIGQHVGVHHQEMFGEIVEQPQRPERAERFGLERIAQRHPELFAVAEIGADQISHVVDRKRCDIEAGAREAADGDLDDRRLADRHQRLGQRHRVGPQPRALAAGENDRVPQDLPRTVRSVPMLNCQPAR